QLPVEVVADRESAADIDERHAFLCWTQAGVQPIVRVGPEWSTGIVEQGSVSGAGEAESRCGAAPAGTLNRANSSRRIKLQLAFAKETKTRFVDGGRTNRPSVCRVDLLCSSGVNAGEIACGRARSLKLRERIERVVVVKIIVEREFL